MKKTKFILAFLLVCVFGIGGTVVVFADVKNDISALDCSVCGADNMDFSNLITSKYFIVMCENSNSQVHLLMQSDSPIVATLGTKGAVYLNVQSVDRVSKGSVVGKVDMTQRPNGFVLTNVPFSWYTYVSHDILDSDGNVFFRSTEVPVVAVARVLPEKVAGAVKRILTIAIGGLALVLGSIILLTKLKKYLVG